MKKGTVLLSLILSGIFCYAQQPDIELANPLPVTPQAAGFTKYGDIPVSLNSGIPNISIPFYTIKTGDISVPVGFSYHAGGIKVEEIASSSGLGWTLFFGGVISRHVRGIADDAPYGYEETGADVEAYLNGEMDSEETHTFLTSYRQGFIDGEKDIYYYSMPGGGSGKFFQDSTNTYVSFPGSNLKISKITVNDNACWKIVDENGLQYFFTVIEYNSSTTFNSVNSGSPTYSFESDAPTSWYLSEIIDTRGNKIEFVYGGNWSTMLLNGGQTKKVLKSTDNPTPTDCDETRTVSHTQSNTSLKRIKEINWKDGMVVFGYTNTGRIDMPSDTALSFVSLFNQQGELIKKIEVFTSYFYNPPTHYLEDSSIVYRLCLDSLRETSINGARLPVYKFEYDSTLMADRRSFSQDIWGYYNGKENTTLVDFYYLNNGNKIKAGADRSVDTAYTQSHMLKKIIYPTRGYTEFEFENNRYAVYKDTFFTFNNSAIAMVSGDNTGPDEHQYLYEFKDTFNISSGAAVYNGKAVLVANIYSTGCEEAGGTFCIAEVKLLDGAGNPVLYNGDTLLLEPGDYILYGRVETEYAQTPYVYLAASLIAGTMHLPGYYDEYSGGLRIKRITHNDGTGITGKKEYNYNSFGEDYSSGSIAYNNNIPQYYREQTDHNHKMIGPQSEYDFYYDCIFDVFSSAPNYPLLTSNGTYTTYGNITVTDQDGDGNPNGKTEYTYTTFNDYTDIIDTGFPFPPVCSFEWKRGLLINERHYGWTGSNFSVLQEKDNVYTFVNTPGDSSRKIIKGMKIGQTEFYNVPSFTHELINSTVQVGTYFTVSELYYLSSDTLTLYSESPANSISEVNNYQYNKTPLLLKSKHTVNSKGETRNSYFKYPSDFTDAGFVGEMLDANMVSVPVEWVESITDQQPDEYVTNGVITTYKSGLLKDKVYKLALASPLQLSGFDESSINGGGTFSMDERYQTLLKFNKYDTVGNIIEQQKDDDVLHTYVWDHLLQYPIASVTNADSASVAYTSFEADGKGNWSYSGVISTDYSSPTGRKSYNLSGGDIIKTGLTSAAYIVSYWGKNGSVTVNTYGPTRSGKVIGDWQYYEHDVTTTSITVSGSKFIDELRLYPKGAQMITYTYTPLTGMTSQSDANGRIVYYEYDAFGRLMLIRDEDKRVVKKICYNYAGQTESCVIYYSALASDNFTRNNCGSGYEGSSVPYIVPAGTYISYVSQNEADSLAEADLDANGQAYANANGNCTSTCNSGNCSGLNKKCINGTCETGVRVCIDSYFDSGMGMFLNTYHYEFSDSSWSSSYQEYDYCDCTGFNCV